MAQKPIVQCLSITAAMIVIALLLLPIIAGLIEGDFGYLCWELGRGWNNKNQTSIATAISEIYLWSFWSVGLREHQPQSHLIYLAFKALHDLH